MHKVTVKGLIDAVGQELIRNGCNNATLKYYRRCWRKISAYFEDKKELYYSHEIAMGFAASVCGEKILNPQQKLSSSDAYLYRIICPLTDFMEKGVILRKYIRRMPYQGNPQSVALLEEFSAYCVKQALSDSTQKNFRRTAERFMLYLDSRDILLSSLDSGMIADYIRTLDGYAKKAMEIIPCGLKSYLRFLYESHYMKGHLADRLPRVATPSKTRIPSVWKQEDLSKLLEAVDRNGPTGKRGYAILLLVTKLGLRSVDVKRLVFSCFNWDRKEICFTQSKTGVSVARPFLSDVGWAAIDYIRNGRPGCGSKYIFLRHCSGQAFL